MASYKQLSLFLVLMLALTAAGADDFCVFKDGKAMTSIVLPEGASGDIYLGEGVIVGDFGPSGGLESAVDLASIRTAVRQAREGH